MVKVTQKPDDQRSYVIPGYTSYKYGEGQDVILTKSHTDKSLAPSSHLHILFSPKHIDLLLSEPTSVYANCFIMLLDGGIVYLQHSHMSCRTSVDSEAWFKINSHLFFFSSALQQCSPNSFEKCRLVI